jgi:hypothetical protein
MVTIVDEVRPFYEAQKLSASTHLALRWKGRVRYTVPREVAGQKSCWKVFQPGPLGIPLRALARMPRFLGVNGCVEGERLASIRKAIGDDAGLSCFRAGAPGPWHKDTILFLSKKTAEPMYIVKAGAGEAVDRLLSNEATWLRNLRAYTPLTNHVPELVAHCAGVDTCFLAQTPLSGHPNFAIGKPQFDFLRKLHAYSLQSMRYEDSRLYRTLNLRVKNLSGLVTKVWAIRIEKAMRQIKNTLTGSSLLLVAAHNDFTPWNIRVEADHAYVFDWEYADQEQLPLFDPLHFALMPMALKNEPPEKITPRMHEILSLCLQGFGEEFCYKAETQALAYFINLCSLYLWTVQGKYDTHPVLDQYALVIDKMCAL